MLEIINRIRGRSNVRSETDIQLDQLRSDIRALEKTVHELKREIAALQRGLSPETDTGAPTTPFADAAREASAVVAAQATPSQPASTTEDSVDNASSQAQAAGKTLIIDEDECIGCGTCVEYTDSVFAMDDNGKAIITGQEGPMDLIHDAIEACPVTCIYWR